MHHCNRPMCNCIKVNCLTIYHIYIYLSPAIIRRIHLKSSNGLYYIYIGLLQSRRRSQLYSACVTYNRLVNSGAFAMSGDRPIYIRLMVAHWVQTGSLVKLKDVLDQHGGIPIMSPIDGVRLCQMDRVLSKICAPTSLYYTQSLPYWAPVTHFQQVCPVIYGIGLRLGVVPTNQCPNMPMCARPLPYWAPAGHVYGVIVSY